MAAQQRLPRLPQAARTRRSSKARSRVVDQLCPPTESAAAALLVFFAPKSHQLCITAKQPKLLLGVGLRCTQLISIPERSDACETCVYFSHLQNGFYLKSPRARFARIAGFWPCFALQDRSRLASIQALRFEHRCAWKSCLWTSAIHGCDAPLAVAEARWPLVGDGCCPRVVAAAIHKLCSGALGNSGSDRGRRAATQSASARHMSGRPGGVSFLAAPRRRAILAPHARRRAQRRLQRFCISAAGSSAGTRHRRGRCRQLRWS